MYRYGFIKEFQPVVERSAEEKVKKPRERRIINNGVTPLK